MFLAFKSLEVHVRGQSLLVRSDNTTVVSYIKFQGGTHSLSLCRLASELWEWCLLRGIHLLAAHIPGEDNLVIIIIITNSYIAHLITVRNINALYRQKWNIEQGN